MMEDRKGIDTKTRLYMHGEKKIREIVAKEMQDKLASKLALMMIKQSGKELAGHRGAPLSSALYKLHE